MITPVFAVLGLITACWYIGVVVLLYRGLNRIGDAPAAVNGNLFSVVIAARNEENSIAECLDTIVAQTVGCDRFEVIVVDDRSTDTTAAIVARYCLKFSNITLVKVAETSPGFSPKKWAVAQGVAVARHDIVVFTDADCRVGTHWLETIDHYFTSGVGVVQGITTYRHLPGMNRLFFSLQSLDFLSHGIVAAAGIGAGIPINSNANNFAFRRAAYRECGGMTTHIAHVVSGDDDLLLQKIWKQGSWKIAFMADPRGAVETLPTPTIGALFGQRARWGSKTVHYHPGQVVLLAGVFAFYCLCAVTILLAFVDRQLFLFAGGLFLVKFTGERLLLVAGLRRFGHSRLLSVHAVASLVHLPMVLAAVVGGIFGKFTWKEQRFSRTIGNRKKDVSAGGPFGRENQ